MRRFEIMLGGSFAVLAIRGAVMYAHHIDGLDQFIGLMTAGIIGGIAARLLIK